MWKNNAIAFVSTLSIAVADFYQNVPHEGITYVFIFIFSYSALNLQDIAEATKNVEINTRKNDGSNGKNADETNQH